MFSQVVGILTDTVYPTANVLRASMPEFLSEPPYKDTKTTCVFPDCLRRSICLVWKERHWMIVDFHCLDTVVNLRRVFTSSLSRIYSITSCGSSSSILFYLWKMKERRHDICFIYKKSYKQVPIQKGIRENKVREHNLFVNFINMKKSKILTR